MCEDIEPLEAEAPLSQKIDHLAEHHRERRLTSTQCPSALSFGSSLSSSTSSPDALSRRRGAHPLMPAVAEVTHFQVRVVAALVLHLEVVECRPMRPHAAQHAPLLERRP